MTAKHLERAELANRPELSRKTFECWLTTGWRIASSRPAAAAYRKAREETGSNSMFKLAGTASMAS